MAQGLSNAPYLIAEAQKASVTFAASPSRLRFQVRTRGFRASTGTVERRRTKVRPGGGEDHEDVVRRGRVREFSFRSRRRLVEMAADLDELEAADLLLTLTLPGEWESVCPDGAAFKRLVRTWRQRFARHMRRIGVPLWAALWFLEFQKRGAPHLHLILWGPGVRDLDVRALRRVVAQSWCEVVGHEDPRERRKHFKAGTSVERMRTSHFGYAAKYASKAQQKKVPAGFRDVGRFWGLWGYRRPSEVVWSVDVDPLEVARIVRRLAGAAWSEDFGAKVVRRFEAAALHSDTFAATLYGTAAVWAAVDLDTSGATSSEGPPSRGPQRLRDAGSG